MALTQVSSAGIKNAEVKTEDILDANITTAKVADNAITGAKVADNLDIPDNNYIRFGTGNDLKLSHNGTNSYIENSTGALIIKSDIISFRNGDDSEQIAYGSADGSISLSFDDSTKLTTALHGISVTGDINMTAELNMTGQGNKFIDTAHLNNVLHFRRINDGDTGHTNTCVVGSNLVWSADFNDTSDEKLKENITSIADGAISKVKQLRPVTFDWKDSTRNNNVSGFIAQEVKTVLPNLVDGTEYDPTIIDAATGCIKSAGYSLNTIGIVANLTKALQEAITRIETLETEVAALKAK
jgi:hypothetical protein